MILARPNIRKTQFPIANPGLIAFVIRHGLVQVCHSAFDTELFGIFEVEFFPTNFIRLNVVNKCDCPHKDAMMAS